MDVIFQDEVEYLIERRLLELLLPFCQFPLIGFLSPAENGNVKNLESDFFVSVKVDKTSQDRDDIGSRVPNTCQAEIAVRCPFSESPEGQAFYNECKTVSSVLNALLGDRCIELSVVGFRCDAFKVVSTVSNFDGDENPSFSKIYTAEIIGRKTN